MLKIIFYRWEYEKLIASWIFSDLTAFIMQPSITRSTFRWKIYLTLGSKSLTACVTVICYGSTAGC